MCVKWSTGGSKYTMLDRELKRFLINEELQSIVQDLPPSFLPDSAPYPFTPPFMNNTLIPDKKSSSQVHAVLCPLSHRAPVIFMHDGTLSIGTGEWKLLKFGRSRVCFLHEIWQCIEKKNKPLRGGDIVGTW